MNIKFNFYDIYAFALPGFLVLAVLWLPFGLILGKWPDVQLSSALVAIILAYFTGIVLQTVAHNALPSSLPNGRYPSSVVLDKEDETFTYEVKALLSKRIMKVFGLDVYLEPAAGVIQKRVDRLRNDAFFLCRSALIKFKTVTYAEQFEGLYALMRGLSAAFAVAVVYYVGWAYSSLLPGRWSGPVVLLGILAGFVGLKSGSRSKIARGMTSALFLVAAFASGHYVGQLVVATSEHRNEFLAAAVFSFFASERCYSNYKFYAKEFVKAVYRDFINGESPSEESAANEDDEAVEET